MSSDQIVNNLEKQPTSPNKLEEFKEYSSKWIAVIGYFLINCTYGTILGSFNPINSQVSVIYDVSPTVVSMNTLLSNLLYLPMAFVASFFMGKFGMRISIWISAAIMIGAAWIRLLINDNYYSVLGAHIMLGIGYPFNQNMLTALPSIWFSPEKRNRITQFLMLSGLLGNVFANILPGLWLDGYDPKQEAYDNYSEGRNKLYNIMCVEAYIATGLGILGCIIFLEKPPTPPGPQEQKENVQYGPQIKEILRNRNYLMVNFSFALYSGCFGGSQVVLSYILASYGFGSEVTTYCNNILIISGVVGIVRISKRFVTDPNYKKYLSLGCITTIVGYGIAIAVLPKDSKSLLILPYVFVGVMSLQAFPLFLSLASEVSFPVSLDISGGLMQGSQQLMNFISGEVFSSIMTKQTQSRSVIVYIILMVCYGVSLLLIFAFKVELKRSEYEAKFKKQQQENNEQLQEIPLEDKQSVAIYKISPYQDKYNKDINNKYTINQP